MIMIMKFFKPAYQNSSYVPPTILCCSADSMYTPAHEWRKNKEKIGLCASSSNFYVSVLSNYGIKYCKMALTQAVLKKNQFLHSALKLKSYERLRIADAM